MLINYDIYNEMEAGFPLLNSSVEPSIEEKVLSAFSIKCDSLDDLDFDIDEEWDGEGEDGMFDDEDEEWEEFDENWEDDFNFDEEDDDFYDEEDHDENHSLFDED